MTAARRGALAATATLLATAPLAIIYERWTWLINCLLVTVAVAAAAAAVRAARGPLVAQIAAMAGALLLMLTWRFSSGGEYAGLLPTADTFTHFGDVLAQLPTDIREHSTPTPDLESLLLVTAAGVGLVALLVDVTVVALRRPALAGLPMLAIYSVPVAVSFESVPVLLFAVGAVGYLWLLGADNVDRVRRFGRRFTGDGRDVDVWEPSPLAAAGRRLALVGVLAALVLPLAVPGMTSGLVDRFGPGLGGGTGTGSGQVNLFAELYGQLNLEEQVELVQVSSDDPEPFYLRLATAGRITDTGFRPSPADGEPVTSNLPGPSASADSGVTYHRHQAQLTVSDEFQMYMAPTYAELTSVNGLDARWRYDPDQQVVFSGEVPAGGSEYEITYLRPEYDPQALREVGRLPAEHDIQERFAQAPEVVEVRQLLDELVDETAAPYDQVRAILGYFSRDNGFRYNLETGPETDAPAIVDFLESKVGFCVQYASAMAWLVRSADLPARVAFGLTRGTGPTESRVLTNRNLHAWTEVYFEGYGWVPFDPTPSARVVGATNPAWAPDPNAPDDSDSSGSPQDPSTGQSPGPGASAGPDGPDIPLDQGLGPSSGGTAESDPPWWGLGVGALALVVIALPGWQRIRLRRRRLSRRGVGGARGAAAAGGTAAGAGTVVSGDDTAALRHRSRLAWDELLDSMTDYQVLPDPTESPRATVRRLAVHPVFDESAPERELWLLGQAEERGRYARTPLPPEGLVGAVTAVRRSLAVRSPRRVRVRALLLPPSTLQRWRMTMSQAWILWSRAVTRLGELSGRLSFRRLLRPTR